ncbi:unnamed protein product [Pleuronectes platessa]|uniref:Uncharacterized protein n=1 Tax=Pleuronectes platessa TaxID=8262 RepID=A0A9N7VTH8_PLEPL|nr:unnamed protein product [Pleuronectes platessa]
MTLLCDRLRTQGQKVFAGKHTDLLSLFRRFVLEKKRPCDRTKVGWKHRSIIGVESLYATFPLSYSGWILDPPPHRPPGWRAPPHCGGWPRGGAGRPVQGTSSAT